MSTIGLGQSNSSFILDVCSHREVEHVMFVCLEYKDSHFKQAYRGMKRQQRKTHLRISVYKYERSIDQRIFAIVNRKSQDANLVDSTHEALQLGGSI